MGTNNLSLDLGKLSTYSIVTYISLKNTDEGDQVEVDEVIAQIETDKVYLVPNHLRK
jgi:hypothetical protein